MNTFQHLDSSDSDDESGRSLLAEETRESKINPYWFGESDSEDDQERGPVLSEQEKLLNAIETACYEAEEFILSGSWTEALQAFNQLKTLSTAKFKKTPRSWLDFISTHSNLKEKLEDKTRSDFKNAREFSSLKQLVSLVEEMCEKFADEIDRLDRESEAGQEEEDLEQQDVSVEDYMATIQKLAIKGNKGYSGKLLAIAKACASKGYSALQITALSFASTALLERISYEDLNKDLIVWGEALETACKCFHHIVINSNINMTEDSSKLSEKTAFITGGFSSILTALYEKFYLLTRGIERDLEDYLRVPFYENRLADLTDSVLGYYQSKGTAFRKVHVRTCAEILLNILGSRRQAGHELLFKKMTLSRCVVTSSIMDTVKELFKLVTSVSDEETKMSAVCYIAYQHGLAGEYRLARDILLRSGIQEYLKAMEDDYSLSPKVPILFNRAIAQIGLAAFLASDIVQAYELLGSIWSYRNHSVLIGESVPPRLKKGTGLSYRRLLVESYHFISYEKLELAALLSALIVDTTNVAKNPYERSWLQKYFYGAISRRIQVCGKPTNIHDQIPAAYSALKEGNYQGAKEIIESIDHWKFFENQKSVFENYLQHLKESALRIFCYVNRCNFSTFAVAQLASKYEMSEENTRRVLNEVISESNALIAYWDRDDANLYVDRSNATRLQHLILQASDIVSDLVPYTERRTRGGDERMGRGRGRGRGGRGGRGRN